MVKKFKPFQTKVTFFPQQKKMKAIIRRSRSINCKTMPKAEKQLIKIFVTTRRWNYGTAICKNA